MPESCAIIPVWTNGGFSLPLSMLLKYLALIPTFSDKASWDSLSACLASLIRLPINSFTFMTGTLSL